MDRPNRDNYYVRDFEVGTLRAYSKAQDEYIDYLNKEPNTPNKSEEKKEPISKKETTEKVEECCNNPFLWAVSC